MRKDIYYWYAPERSRQRRSKKMRKIWFARVLVNEAHDIDNLLLKNLVTLVGEGSSILFITRTSLSNGAKKFAGFVKC